MVLRLIDANAMRKDWLENGENEYVYDTNAVLESIDAQPTVDAVEVVHGRWSMEKYPFTLCSVCGLKRDCEYDFGWNYCPNCGADMRERKDNERKAD